MDVRRPILFLYSLILCATLSAQASAQLEQARKAYRSGDYSRAEKLATKLSSKGKNRAQGTLLLARVQLDTGRYQEAAKTASRATKFKSHRADAQSLRGEAFLKIGRISDALTELESAVRTYGDTKGFRTRVILARAYERDGNLLSARSMYNSVADAYNEDYINESDAEGLAAVASAVVALDYFQDGNETFALATKADPSRVETQTEWARLFLEKYDPGHAEECLRDALKANPNHAVARLLLAKVRMKQGFKFVQASAEIEKALKTNPNYSEAYAFKATLDVRDRLWEQAHKNIGRALAIDPTDPYALSLRAATYYIADDRRNYKKAVSKLRGRNPRYSGHYAVLTDLLEWEHRYEEIVKLNREALEIDAGYGQAHAAIGINLMRLGEEEQGLQELRASWEQDQFNVLVFNMLNLYEDVLSKEYNFVKHGQIHYRYHRDEQKVLDRYLPKLLSRAYTEMSRRYKIRPVGTKIEIFANEDHLARRSVGLPRVGVQGICFGKVVVAGGPRAFPVNYGQVLWHELGHVFTIQASKSRIPRWFTEGLSVHEERLGSQHWGRNDDGMLYRWIKAGRMPPVSALNTAFSRAKSGQEIGLAYYGSAVMVEYIKGRYGWPRVLQMLKAYGRGKRTEQVIKSVLKVGPADFDRQFRQDTLKKLDHYKNNFVVDYRWHFDLPALVKAVKARPNDAQALGQAAVGAMAHRDPQKALLFAQKAIKLDPAQPEARHVLSDIGAAKRDFTAAEAHAKALISKGIDGYALRLNLAEVYFRTKKQGQAITQLKAASKLDPQKSEPHMTLAKIYLDSRQDALALAELKRSADLDPHDRGLYRELLKRLDKQGNWAEVIRYGERSLWNDPLYTELHLQLARAYEKTKNQKKAVFEYQTALLCETKNKSSVHVAFAEYYKRRGNKRNALREAKRAVEANPNDQKAKSLVQSLKKGR